MFPIIIELEELSKVQILRYLHFSVCILGSIILFFIIWSRRKNNELVQDECGCFLIAGAFMLWSAMDLYRILGFMKMGQVDILLKTFSTYNNALFIAALPFFDKSFVSIRSHFHFFKDKNQWIIFVLVSNIGVMLMYFLAWNTHAESNNAFIKNFDMIYSVLTFIALGWAMIQTFRSFENERFLYYLSIFGTVILVIPQMFFASIFKITNFDIISLFLFISHILLIYLVIILAQKIDSEQIIKTKKIEISKIKEMQIEKQEYIQKLTDSLMKAEIDIQELKEQIKNNEYELIAMKKINTKNIETAKLSDREIDVLKLINKSYAEIGAILYISKETVITHKKNIESKLGISGKEQLIEYAKKIELLNTI